MLNLLQAYEFQDKIKRTHTEITKRFKNKTKADGTSKGKNIFDYSVCTLVEGTLNK